MATRKKKTPTIKVHQGVPPKVTKNPTVGSVVKAGTTPRKPRATRTVKPRPMNSCCR